MKKLFIIFLFFPNIFFGSEDLVKKIYLKAKIDFISIGCSFQNLNSFVTDKSKVLKKKDLECIEYYIDNTFPSFNEIELKYPNSLVFKTLSQSDEYIQKN